MKNFKQVRLVKLSFLFLAISFLMLFSTFSGKAQSVSPKCGWEWKWVYDWEWETQYNIATGRYETEKVYKRVYKRVYECDSTIAENDTTSSSNINSSDEVAPSGEIRKLWIDHDVHDNQQKGMLIHLTFSARRLKDKQCTANAYFYNASGKPLKDFNDKYSTTDGQVATHANFTPRYTSSVYKDFQLFMPYTELHMAAGEFDLKFFVKLRCEGIGLIARSEDYAFNYSKPK